MESKIVGSESAVEYQDSVLKLSIVDGIMMADYLRTIKVDLPLAMHLVTKRIELGGGKSYPVLSDISNLKGMNKEARAYMKKEGYQDITAFAIVVNTRLNSMLGSFFMALENPDVPTRIFSDKTKAINWLETYKT